MTDVKRHLEQHLSLLLEACGGDAPVDVPRAVQRPAGPARPTAPARPRTERQAPAMPGTAGTAVAPPRPPTPAPLPPPAPPPAVVAPSAPPRSADPDGNREVALRAVCSEVGSCTKCKLHEGRRNTVFGEGNPGTRVLFVGEAPGAEEDRTGRPFVGPAGQLLDRILQGAMGLQRRDVYIANINKCRPPANRAPEADEVAACLPYLHRQVDILKPEVIVCLGRTAAQNLLATTASTTQLRGKTHSFQGVPVIVTWHPAYLLRDPSHKGETWEDIKRVNRLLGLPDVPGRPSGNQP